ncbi:MAG: hypothetical protein WC695_01185 [Candidatus Omnitrophota bacterium]
MMKIACLILFVLAQLSAPHVSYAKVIQRCHMCGMDAAKSQTEFVVYLSDESTQHTCCMHCVYLLEKFIVPLKVVKMETRDFATGMLIDASKAYYLEASSLMPKGSMAPFLLAFLEEQAVQKFKKKYKGNILTFKEAMEAVARFDAEVSSK